MKPFVIFTTPGDAHVELRHDSGQTFPGTPGMADGRPAHLIDLPDSLPEGHGAQIVITRDGYASVEHRGTLWLRRSGLRAEFAVDDIHLTKVSHPFH